MTEKELYSSDMILLLTLPTHFLHTAIIMIIAIKLQSRRLTFIGFKRDAFINSLISASTIASVYNLH